MGCNKNMKRVKYATGTPITGYMTNPDDVIRQNQINLAQAQYEAESNPWVNALSALMAMGTQAGMSAMNKPTVPSFANGGVVPMQPIKPFKKYTKKDVQKMSPRIGEHYLFNNSGQPSTHLMATGESDGKYYAFPTLFQNPKDSTWYQPDDPFGEAMRRKELFEFPSEKESQDFAEGSWKKMAYGGSVGRVPVEVEGNESAQLPSGQMLNFNGASHNNGGMNVDLPPATKIYSNRIKVDGVSMADRKDKRERKTMTLEKLLAKNSSDIFTRNSLSRTKEVNAKEEQNDLEIQTLVGQMVDEKTGKRKKFALGTNRWGIDPNDIRFRPKVDPMQFARPEIQGALLGVDPSEPVPGVSTFGQNVAGLPPLNMTPPAANKGFMNKQGMPTLGDIMGVAGNLYQGFSPYYSTLQQRGQGTPNINAYENYGKEALKTIDDASGYAAQLKDQQMRDLALSANTAKTANRRSARGINTLRALDLATQQQANQQANQISSQYADRMSGFAGTKANMQMQRDQIVMGGAGAKDLADRQDAGAFFTNLANSKIGIGKAITMGGKSINDMLERGQRERMLNQMYHNVGVNPRTGEMYAKPGADPRVQGLVRAAKMLTAKQVGATDEDFLLWTDQDKFNFLTRGK